MTEIDGGSLKPFTRSGIAGARALEYYSLSAHSQRFSGSATFDFLAQIYNCWALCQVRCPVVPIYIQISHSLITGTIW